VPECRHRMSEGSVGLIAGAIRRVFPSDAELLEDLGRIAISGPDHMDFNAQHWAEGFVGRADEVRRIPYLLERFLDREFSMETFRLAAVVIRYQGTRAALSVLRRFLDPECDPSLRSICSDAEFAVTRRSLT